MLEFNFLVGISPEKIADLLIVERLVKMSSYDKTSFMIGGLNRGRTLQSTFKL